MGSYSWVARLHPGCEEEYKQRHDEIWPEMVSELKNAGMRKYVIFRHGLTLFGYFEADDIARTIEILGRSEVRARWSASMAPLMKTEIDPRTNFPYLLPLQWQMA